VGERNEVLKSMYVFG